MHSGKSNERSNVAADDDAMHTKPTVLVLGGGPAGACVAIQLARAGVHTAVCERAHEFCRRSGEALTPAGRPLLQSLGVYDQLDRDRQLRSPGVVSVWEDEAPRENDFLFSPYGHGWHVDRPRFDRSLLSAAETAGVEVYRGCRPIAVKRTPAGWAVDVLLSNRRTRFDPRFIVDATGRACWLGRRLGFRRTDIDLLFGVIAQIQVGIGTKYEERRLLLEATESGWWYCALFPENTVVAGFVTDMTVSPTLVSNPRALWETQCNRTRYVREQLKGTSLPKSLSVVSASSFRMSSVAGIGWLAVGDSSTAWDPLSSQGVVKALQDGIAAAPVVIEALQGNDGALNDHQRRSEKAFEEYLQVRESYYSRVRQWPLSPFWRRRQAGSRATQSTK